MSTRADAPFPERRPHLDLADVCVREVELPVAWHPSPVVRPVGPGRLRQGTVAGSAAPGSSARCAGPRTFCFFPFTLFPPPSQLPTSSLDARVGTNTLFDPMNTSSCGGGAAHANRGGWGAYDQRCATPQHSPTAGLEPRRN